VSHDFRLTEHNAPAVLGICTRLEGIPLALELAAARIRVLPPQAMLARLHSQLSLLTGGARDLPARQQTMHAAIQWSYDLLDAHEQATFRQLSVFVRGCTLEAAEQMLGESALDGIASLVDKSMLRQDRAADGDMRFRMLQIMREFGMEKLAESGEEDPVRRRHALFFLKLAERAEPQLAGDQQLDALRRLEAEHDNLRAAMEWANRHGEAEIGLRIAGALWRFWYMKGHLTEGRRWLMGLLGLPEAAGRTAARARALNGAANLIYNIGEYDIAHALHEEALAIWRELGDRRAVAGSLNNLGLILRNKGEYARARALFEEALSINLDVGNRDWQAINLNNLGTVAHQQHDLSAARTYHQRSVELFRAVQDRWGTAMALADLGKVLSDQADYHGARQLLDEALALQKEMGDRRGVADTLNAIGQIAWKHGDYRHARAMFEESLKAFQELGDRKGIAMSLNHLGNVTLYQGDLAPARSFYERSLAMRRELGDRRDLAASHNNLGLVALWLGDHARARQLLEEAVALWQEVGDDERTSVSLSNLGRAALHRGQHAEARHLFERSLDLARRVADDWSLAYALSGLAQLDMAEANPQKADVLMQQSLSIRHRLGDQRGTARILLGLAGARYLQGRTGHATRVAAAGTALMEATGAGLEPGLQAQHERLLGELRAALGEEAFAMAWAEGTAMTADQAVSFAVEGAHGDEQRDV
jgi:predicted ATPase/predicted negative regulator of RcsB-dependent stress response